VIAEDILKTPDSARYKALGNAVTPNVVEAVAKRLLSEMIA